jgi:type I restriction enzyme S subunit
MNMDKNEPEIRFEGFSGEWINKILVDVLSERKILQKISSDAPLLSFAAGQGVIDRSERKSNNRDHLTLDQANKIFKLTEFNDIVYNPSNLKYGAIDRNKHGRGVISPIYVTFTTEEIPSFIEMIVKSEKFKLRALIYEEGTVVKRQSVKPENLLSLDVNISPSLDEQTKIGNYFQKLDGLINQHQKKHDKLSNIKKTMLEKMFPKVDETVPEIRFTEFSGDWDEHSFTESFTFVGTNTLSRADLNYEQGNAKNIHYGDILVNFGQILDLNKEKLPFITSADIAQKLSSRKLKDGDIVFADAAEDDNVGKCTEILNVKNATVLAGLHTIAARPSQEHAPSYLGYYLNSNAFHNQLLTLMQGTKVLSISKTAINTTSIKSPKNASEQAKIGSYFQNLDELISQHQQQIIKLKNIKLACLDKMFV